MSDEIEIYHGSGNVFADIELKDADKLSVRAQIGFCAHYPRNYPSNACMTVWKISSPIGTISTLPSSGLCNAGSGCNLAASTF